MRLIHHRYLLTALSIPGISQTEDAIHRHNYLWANYQQFGNQTAAAQQRYNLLLSCKTPSLHVQKGYIYFLYKTNQLKRIIEYSHFIDTSYAHDPELQIMLIHALEKTGNTQQARQQLQKAYLKCPQDPQIVLEISQAYINNKELHNALSTLDTFLNSTPKKQTHFVFHFVKAQIYVQLKQPHKALDSIKECLTLHQGFDKGWLIRAMIEEQLGELEAAIQGYTTFLELTGGTNAIISSHLTQLTLKQKMASSLPKHFKQPARSHFEEALVLYERKQYKHALTHVNTHLKEQPEDINGRLLTIQILSTMRSFSQAIELLRTWITKEPTNQVWFEALHLLGHNGAAPGSVLAALTAISHDHPHNAWAALYAADIHMRMGATSSAIATLERIEKHVQDTQLKTKILFYLGLLNFEAGNYTRTQEHLEQGYALKTNFLPLLNLLAYHYATKGKNVARAQEIMQPVIAHEPNNPHYQDTHALIEYKKGNLPLAQTMFEKIHSQYPRDTTITLHLAKTLYKQGHIAKAKTLLETAKVSAQSTYEKKIVTKLTAAWKS